MCWRASGPPTSRSVPPVVDATASSDRAERCGTPPAPGRPLHGGVVSSNVELYPTNVGAFHNQRWVCDAGTGRISERWLRHGQRWSTAAGADGRSMAVWGGQRAGLSGVDGDSSRDSCWRTETTRPVARVQRLLPFRCDLPEPLVDGQRGQPDGLVQSLNDS